MGFAPTRSFTIDDVDFHPSVDRVKALGGAVAFAAWICFGGPRVVIDFDETESGRGNVYPGEPSRCLTTSCSRPPFSRGSGADSEGDWR